MTDSNSVGLGAFVFTILSGAFLLAGLLMGAHTTQFRITDDCQTFGAFKADGKVYECKERKND